MAKLKNMVIDTDHYSAENKAGRVPLPVGRAGFKPVRNPVFSATYLKNIAGIAHPAPMGYPSFCKTFGVAFVVILYLNGGSNLFLYPLAILAGYLPLP